MPDCQYSIKGTIFERNHTESHSKIFVHLYRTMRIKFLNNGARNRQYDYSPMYYDERKEELQQKKDLYKRAQNGELTAEEKKSMLKDQMRRSWQHGEYRKNEQRRINLRILLLVVILSALLYFIIYGVDSIDNVVEKLW